MDVVFVCGVYCDFLPTFILHGLYLSCFFGVLHKNRLEHVDYR